MSDKLNTELTAIYEKQKAEGTLPPTTYGPGPRKPQGGTRIKLAKSFLDRFPVGSAFYVTDFDAWCAKNDLLKLPSKDAMVDKKSDGWMAHSQRRHHAKVMLNNIGIQPRLIDYGITPFWIASIGDGEWKVRSPVEQMAAGHHGSRVNSLADTWTERLQHFMESAAFAQLPARVQAKAEVVYNEGIQFHEKVWNGSRLLKIGCRELQTMLQAVVPSAAVKALGLGNGDEDEDELGDGTE